MGQNIVDIDEVVPPEMGFRLDGKVYGFPGDVDVPDYLEIARLFDSLGEEPENADEEDPRFLALHRKILGLFQQVDPKANPPLGPKRLAVIVISVMTGLNGKDEDEAGKAKPKSKAAGTRSTRSKPKPRAKSRSSR